MYTLFILSAPSGTGKTTLCNMLLRALPKLKTSVTYTTRKQREIEENGKDYWFISLEEFNRKIEANEFIEYANVFGNMYGTSQTDIEKLLETNPVILNIDVQGNEQVKQKIKTLKSIFLVPPSLEVLAERLRLRKTDSEEEIKRRLKIAEKELKKSEEYDIIIINEDLNKAFEELRTIINNNSRIV